LTDGSASSSQRKPLSPLAIAVTLMALAVGIMLWAEGSPGRTIRLAPPWSDGELSRYVVMRSGSVDESIGHAEIGIRVQGDATSLVFDYAEPGFSKRSEVTAETYGLLPSRTIIQRESSEGGIAAITAVYHSAEGAASPQRSSPQGTVQGTLQSTPGTPRISAADVEVVGARGIESARRDLEGNVRWDTEEMMHVIRALPLKERFRASFDVFDPANAAQYSVVVQVTSVETMSTPSGEFRCWRVDVEGLGMRVWVAVEYPYQLVSFELVNRRTVGMLTHYVIGGGTDP
jgi:hypothetical protein